MDGWPCTRCGLINLSRRHIASREAGSKSEKISCSGSLQNTWRAHASDRATEICRGTCWQNVVPNGNASCQSPPARLGYMLACGRVVMPQQPVTLGANDVFGQIGNIPKIAGVCRQLLGIEADLGKQIAIVWYVHRGVSDNFRQLAPRIASAVWRMAKPSRIRGHEPSNGCRGSRGARPNDRPRRPQRGLLRR